MIFIGKNSQYFFLSLLVKHQTSLQMCNNACEFFTDSLSIIKWQTRYLALFCYKQKSTVVLDFLINVYD